MITIDKFEYLTHKSEITGQEMTEVMSVTICIIIYYN